MKQLSCDYRENVRALGAELRVSENFDMVSRRLLVGTDELTAFYIDGFIKDTSVQKMFQFFLTLPALERGADAARRFCEGRVPYVEVECTRDIEKLVFFVLSGALVLLGSTFGGEAVIIDART